MKNEQIFPQLEIKDSLNGFGVYATHTIPENATLFIMQGKILNYPTRTSVQIDENRHIEDPIAGCMNHACKPNARVDRKNRAFISLRKIDKDEEITFDYRENEDALACPFVCSCCQKKITGKRLLPS